MRTAGTIFFSIMLLHTNAQEAFYLETFDESFGDWTQHTQEGIVDWVWTDEGPGSTGSTYPVPPLNTSTGWAMIDDDHEGQIGMPTEAFLVSPVIDLSSAPPDLKLEFDQYFQEWQNDLTYVGISTNGGISWTEVLINQGVGRDLRPNPELKSINISDLVAADPANVQIRFRYKSIWDYGWQIDNIGIYELPPYELELIDGTISHSGDGTEFGRVPADQFGTELYVAAQLFNGGSMPLNDVIVSIEVFGPNGLPAYTHDLQLAELPSWDTVTVSAMITVPPSVAGIYHATFTATCTEGGQESDPTNNAHHHNYSIEADMYCLDGIGVHPPENERTLSIGTGSFLDNADALLLMNYFLVREPLTVYGLQFDLGPGSQPGGFVVVNILDSSEVVSDLVDQPLEQSELHDITQSDIDAGTVNVAFNSPVLLQPGAYYAGVSLNSISNTADISIVDDATVAQPVRAALINTSSDGLTYANGNAFAIRLLLDGSAISVEEAQGDLHFSVEPNPTSGQISIDMNGHDRFDYELRDLAGRTIRSGAAPTPAMDISDLPGGVYVLKIMSRGSIGTARVVKQ